MTNKLPGWRFWALWLLGITASGGLAGAAASFNVDWLGMVFWWDWALTGALFGAGLGVMQWFLLRRAMPMSKWWPWITAAALALGFPLCNFALEQADLGSQVLILVGAAHWTPDGGMVWDPTCGAPCILHWAAVTDWINNAVWGLLIGLLVGLLQWRVLGRRLPRAYRWLLGCAVFCAIGFPVGYSLGLEAGLAGWGIAGEATGTILLGAIVGVVTATAMVWLLRRAPPATP